MIGAPYTYIAGGLALTAALGGSYAYGRSDGRSLERDAQARALAAVKGIVGKRLTYKGPNATN